MNLFGILTGKVRRMSHVHRYSSFAVHRRENVAEHSWWVAFTAYLIGVDLSGRGVVVDLGNLLSRAICHDLSECISGDIIRSYKYGSERMRCATLAADSENMRRLAGEIEGAGFAVRVAWEHAKDDDTEGQIVRFADMLAVVVYCREEWSMGNREIESVLKELYETWFNEYHEHPLFGVYMTKIFPGRRYNDALQRGVLAGIPMMRRREPVG